MTRHRLPRILLNAATVLSLALCVATALLWVRSDRHAPTLGLAREHHLRSIGFHNGNVSVMSL
jgi:hypothetical protein